MAFFESIITGFITSLLYDGYKNLAVKNDDEFLNYSPSFLLKKYSHAHPIDIGIPYSELIDFTKNTKSIALQVNKLDFKVILDNDMWQQISNEGYNLLKKDRIDENEAAIRLFRIEETDSQIILHVNRTFYHEQAKSNLILDYKSKDYSTTIRELLIQKHSNGLPPLDTPTLANNVGVAIIVFYKNLEEWIPYMVRRPRNLGVFPGGLHCTSSGVAKWPADSSESTVSNFFEKHILNELKEEVGLVADDLYDFKLLSLCREFTRAGKPQLFYAAKTDLNLDDLIAKRKNAAKFLKQANLRAEVADRWYIPEKIKNGNELISDFKKYNVTLEGVMSLHLGLKYIA